MPLSQDLTPLVQSARSYITGPGMLNLALVRAQTSVAGDSIKLTSADGTALSASNFGTIYMPSAGTPGEYIKFTVIADITINLTGAHWGQDTYGDLTARLLRILGINENDTTFKVGVALLGGRHTVLTTDTSATATDINLPEEILCNSAIGNASNTCVDIGFCRSDFDDTGGSSENLNTIQSGVADVVTGRNADGLWQPWNPDYTGFSADPANSVSRWTQIGREIIVVDTNNTAGTSNATTFTIDNAPAKNRIAFACSSLSVQTDAGTVSNGLGSVAMQSADSRVLTMRHSVGGPSGWTNVSSKQAYFTFSYEVGPAASFID